MGLIFRTRWRIAPMKIKILIGISILLIKVTKVFELTGGYPYQILQVLRIFFNGICFVKLTHPHFFVQNFEFFRNLVYRDFFCKIDRALTIWSNIWSFSEISFKKISYVKWTPLPLTF